jgi:citrate lyase subunit beta/citryl-CoA lyase
MNPTASAGRKGPDVRSDCWVQIQARESGGLEIRLQSKVASMYGDSIHRTAEQTLGGLGIEHAAVDLVDSGAVPFVIMARIEAAARRAGLYEGPGVLPAMDPCCTYGTTRERFRRSRLYLPGNESKFMLSAGLHRPDGIILDLEDSVAPAEKDAARLLVRNALCQVDFHGAERMVRINQLPLGLDDLEAVAPCNVHVVLIPKCESKKQVKAVDRRCRELLEAAGKPEAEIFLMPIIESARGAIKAYKIAKASPRVIALAVGLEDYTADIGTQRTLEGRESFWARSQVVNAARAAGVSPIDTVFSDVGDMEGLRESVLEARALGFDGKGCIHPRQIRVIHEAMAPSGKELERAKKIVTAFNKAEAQGLGVVSLGSKMIDPPVVKRALRTVDVAVAGGLLDADWLETEAGSSSGGDGK